MATDSTNRPDDPTPIVAAPTDVAPLTHHAPKRRMNGPPAMMPIAKAIRERIPAK